MKATKTKRGLNQEFQGQHPIVAALDGSKLLRVGFSEDALHLIFDSFELLGIFGELLHLSGVDKELLHEGLAPLCLISKCDNIFNLRMSRS